MIENILVLECDSSQLAYNIQFKYIKRNLERKNINVSRIEIDQRINQIDSLTKMLEIYPVMRDFRLNSFEVIVFSISGECKVKISKGLVDDLNKAISSFKKMSFVVCISQSKLSRKETISQRELFEGQIIDHTEYPIDSRQIYELFWGKLQKK